MRQSTTPSLSQTIWPRWPSRQFLSLPLVQTLLPVTFGYSLSSEAVIRYETIQEMKEAMTKVIDTLTQEDFHGALQKLLEWYNKCIAARGDYFEGDSSFMCVLSIKVPIRKKSGKLFNDPRKFTFERSSWSTFAAFDVSSYWYKIFFWNQQWVRYKNKYFGYDVSWY